MVFKSFIARRAKPVSRINTELTERARERMSSITQPIESEHKNQTLKELQDERGVGEIKHFFRPYSDGSGLSSDNTQNKIILSGDKEIVFSYIEHLFRIILNEKKDQAFSVVSYYSQNFLAEMLDKLQDVLITEGILWEIKVKRDESGNFFIEFIELSSLMQKESDEELQSLYLGTEWETPLKPYNDAYNIFLSGRHTTEIAEKLYNVFENIMKKVCLDKEWESNDSLTINKYLSKMKEEKFFSQNNIMIEEISDLINSMEKTISKIGGDRKRHIEIDKYFCNLLLHQTSAWIVYIIKKYNELKEKQDGN